AVRYVDLVERHQPGTVGEPTVRGQFRLDRLDVTDRVTARVGRGAVDDVHQYRAPFDMPQELQAQALSGGGAGDETGHVRDHERGVVDTHHSEVGHQGGERVVGDLGPGGGHHRDERRLTGRGEPDQPDVGDTLELEDHVPPLPRLTQLREAGDPASGGGQRGVAAPSPPAAGGHVPGAGPDQVGEHLPARRLHDRAVGHPDHETLAVRAGLVRTGARAAVGRSQVGPEVEVEQGVHARVALEHDVATPAAVAAVGASARLELLPAD